MPTNAGRAGKIRPAGMPARGAAQTRPLADVLDPPPEVMSMNRRLARVSILTLLVCLFGAATSVARAQSGDPPPVLEGRPDADPTQTGASGAGLGAVFESQSAGIAFRAPADCKPIRRPGADEIVQFVNDAKKWHLRVHRIQFGNPMPVATRLDPQTKKPVPGLLDMSLDQFKVDKPGAEVLREEVIPLGGDTVVGMITARYNEGLETFLHQQALLRQSDRTYAIFTMTSPAPRGGAGEEIAQDPRVRDAVETFNAVVDSVHVIDQSHIREEQQQRLYRTRALFLNVTENRLRNALIKEQWLRMIDAKGRDVGYMYVVEEVAPDLPKKKAPKKPSRAEGVRIGVRLRTLPEAGVQADAEQWMWMAFDKRHEQWSGAATVKKGTVETYVSEFGVSDHQERRALDKKARPGELRPDGSKDINQPAVNVDEFYVLSVTHISKTATAEPVRRELPVFYIPQALGHLLPRLLPLFEQKGYMFASYESENREVMSRYVDVGREEQVQLGGKALRAIPIRDRIGLEGAVTTHYMSPEGVFLGSVNEETKITYLPTDRATLMNIWKDADLSRPGDVDDGAPATPQQQQQSRSPR